MGSVLEVGICSSEVGTSEISGWSCAVYSYI